MKKLNSQQGPPKAKFSKFDKYYGKHINQYTGEPRRWHYRGVNGRVDDLLELAEAEATFWSHGEGTGFQNRPLDVHRKMAEALLLLVGLEREEYSYANLRHGLLDTLDAKEDTAAKVALTEAETRYCVTEDIAPADFMAQKSNRQETR